MSARSSFRQNSGTWILVVCLLACGAAPFTAAPAQDLDCVDLDQQPRALATLTIAAGDAAEVVAVGGAAYVRVADMGLVVVDWSEPADPLVVTTLGLEQGARALAAGDGALYVLDGAGQLTVFDLADPLSPVDLGPVAGCAEANDLAVAGDVGYLVLAAGGLQAIDLTAPLAPVPGAELGIEGGDRAVALDGDRAYLVGVGHLDHDHGAFHVVDLADPLQPALVGSFATDGTGWGFADRYKDVQVCDAGVYVVHESAWYDWDADYSYQYTYLRRFDVSNPHAPLPSTRVISASDTDFVAAHCLGQVVVAGALESGPQDPWCPDCVYDDAHLEIRRADVAYQLPPLFDLPLPAEPLGVTWSAGHLLVACGTAGLQILAAPMLDVIQQPSLSPTFPPDEIVGERALLDGDRLAVSYHHEGGCSPGDEDWASVTLYDVSSGSPQLVDDYAAPYWGLPDELIFVGEHHLYADWAILSLVGDEVTYEAPFAGFNGAAFAGDYLVTADGDGAHAWDVSDPVAPVEVSALDLPWTYDVATEGGHVYLATGTALVVAAVGADGSLGEVGSIAPACSPRQVACAGGLLAVGGLEGELLIYEVVEGAELALLAELDLGARIRDLDFGTQLYVAVEDLGYAVVDAAADPPGVTGWFDGAAPAGVSAEGALMVLADGCPGRIHVGPQVCPSGPTTVPDPGESVPPRVRQVSIEGAWPNPANPLVSVAFEMRRAAWTQVEVVDLAGRRVAELAAGQRSAGRHVLQWDGKDGAGRAAPSGVYLVRVRAAGESDARKVLLAR